MNKVIPLLLAFVVLASGSIHSEEQQTVITQQIEKLHSSVNRVRINAVIAIGKVGEPAKFAAPYIIRAMAKDEVGYPNFPYYAEALENIGYDPAQDLVKAVINNDHRITDELATVMRMTKPEGIKEIVPALINALNSNSNDIFMRIRAIDTRVRAAEVLGVLGNFAEDAIPALVDRLKDEEPLVRSRAAMAIGRMGPAAVKAIPALIEALQDEKYHVRLSAVGALEGIGPLAKKAIPALVEALNDDAVGVASRAKRALDAIGPEITLSPEELFLDLISKDIQKEKEARANLRKLGQASGEMVQYLITILRGKDEGNQLRAISALRAIGPFAEDAVPVLVPFLKSESEVVRHFTVGALSKICAKSEKYIPTFVDVFLNDGDIFVRTEAARALGNIGAKAVPTLITLLKNNDPFIRANAAHTIRAIDNPAAKNAIPSLRKALKDVDDEVRIEAAIALGYVGWEEKEAVPILVEVLNTPLAKEDQATSLAARKMGAFLALHRIGTPEALEAIEHLKPEAVKKGSKH